MKRLSFLDKTKELLLYTDRYETVTLFELTQLYGSSGAAFLAFLISLPMVVLPIQLICLPACFLILSLSALMLFDERVWLFDALKRKAIPSPAIKKGASFVIRFLEMIPKGNLFERYETIFRTINPLLLILASLQVGFLHIDYFSILAIVAVSLASVIENGYLCVLGYLLFFIGLI
ncbi:MAG: exopolysaccharide biosynthesis protein [Verrucomicrobia bacterium]|nr:exopolysaccharide biosynthesis protein [Verrucomicrobiota bacterium]MBS0638202.1 exopolysaccharide biosynthesis protein [Verrucomicrobiota bacterium]